MAEKTTSNSKATKLKKLKTVATHITRKKQVSVVRMPKLMPFTKEMVLSLWRDKRLFGSLLLFAIVVSLVLFGAAQQDQYTAVTTALNDSTQQIVGLKRFGLLIGITATGGLNDAMSEMQKVYFTLLYILIGLTAIWLLRHRLADMTVSLRDGLYNAAAPIVSLTVLFVVGVVQLLPMAIGIIAYSAAVTSGIIHGPIETALFALFALGLSIGSLYWLMGTVIAAMIATNQGTYPFQALRAAGKVVVGRRVKLMIHLVWLILLLVILWAVVLVPATLLDDWLQQSFLPFVVGAVQVLSSFSVIVASTYIYLLYRKMIDEPGK